MQSDQNAPTPSFQQALRVWLRIGLLSFGGPAAQIALMHRELVERHRWLSEKEYLNALSFCMLLPGPEAMQLATYAGLRLHGTRGGLAAGLLFVLPGALVIMVLASIYAWFGNVPLVEALFLGVKAAVVVIVIEALLRVAKKTLHSSTHWAIAALAFIAIFFFQLPFPLIIGCAALFGFVFHHNSASQSEDTPAQALVPIATTIRTAAIWLVVWLLPLSILYLSLEAGVMRDAGIFFSKLAVVTFGGAYAVLAYMAQDVVSQFGWLSTGEMMDALGLAETTPGPLILVTEFVGFLAGFREQGFLYAVAVALVVLWATFAPCFLWIFVGAPYIDWLSSQPRLKNALACITAAVVGVILNLSLWFALHVMFTEVHSTKIGALHLWLPEPGSLDWRVVLLTILSGFLLLYRHWGVTIVLAVAAAGGLLLSQV